MEVGLCLVEQRGQHYQQGRASDKNERASAFSEEMESDWPGSTLPLLHNEEKREAFHSFFPSFLISLIADRSGSHPRDAITDLFCFTSSSGPSSTFSHCFDKSIYSGGSSFPFSPRRRNFLSLPGDLALLHTSQFHVFHRVQKCASCVIPHLDISSKLVPERKHADANQRRCQ